MSESARIRVGSVVIEADNLDKVLFPKSGLTKEDLISYYRRISDTMLPHVRDRAVSMERYPDGISEQGFYQKEAPDHFPTWVNTKRLKNRGEGHTTYTVVNKAATLVYMADQAVVTPHVWLSRVDRPEKPDRLIFDLDPAAEDFGPVRRAARTLRAALEDVGLAPFLMTTGSRGLHVVVPLDRSSDFGDARAFAEGIAELVAAERPDELTTEQRKNKRRGRLFLDTARNAYGQTGVAPYSVRARTNAPVATPLDWDELGNSALTSDMYTVSSIFRRLGQREDPWKGIGRHARGLEKPAARLADALAQD